ncbi:MAG: 2-C-methyl-D-erythritol 2,4-cyclodiphosphate synthase [Tissierellia bacterium]|nr:2-C-methyl-D-erythritol 2,4-cyclodiphosphate synthase [Tissierellia bacterium]
MRVGLGYDVHKLVKDRELILGGVKFDFEKGLLGHSDADVLTHAIMDALLGAMCEGDIGYLFPDSDMKYKDISSLILLDRVIELVEKRGYEIVNIDTVIICERPKILPMRKEIQKTLSKHLKIDEDQISIKASTSEKLGFYGREEGIEARAIALIERRN